MYICGFFQYKIEKREESEEEEDDDDDDDDFGMNKKKEEEEMDPMMSECRMGLVVGEISFLVVEDVGFYSPLNFGGHHLGTGFKTAEG